jgi:hypothetical protein
LFFTSILIKQNFINFLHRSYIFSYDVNFFFWRWFFVYAQSHFTSSSSQMWINKFFHIKTEWNHEYKVKRCSQRFPSEVSKAHIVYSLHTKSSSSELELESRDNITKREMIWKTKVDNELSHTFTSPFIFYVVVSLFAFIIFVISIPRFLKSSLSSFDSHTVPSKKNEKKRKFIHFLL